MNQSVLFIHGIAEIGGAERELLAVLEHLPESGYCPIVVTVEEGPLIQQLHALGIDTRHAPMPPWRKFFAYSQRGAAVRRLREVILAAKPAVLHVNDIWWMPQVLRAAEGTGIPVVGHVRQEIQPWKVHRYGLHQADLVFAVSRGIHDALAAGGVLKERIRTLHSGLDLRRVPDLDDGVETRHRLGIPGDAPLLGNRLRARWPATCERDDLDVRNVAHGLQVANTKGALAYQSNLHPEILVATWRKTPRGR